MLLVLLAIMLILPTPLPIVVAPAADVVCRVKSPTLSVVMVGPLMPAPDEFKVILPSRDPVRPSDKVSAVEEVLSVSARIVPSGLEILNELSVGRLKLKFELVETMPPLLRLKTPVTFRFS